MAQRCSSLPLDTDLALGSGVQPIKEPTMAKDPFEQFAIPNEMRSFAEQSVAQAKKAFDSFIKATNQAIGQFDEHARAARGNAQEIAHKSMSYAEQNVAASFDLAQKLMRAKDAAEVMGLQSEYLSRQMQSLSAQVQELGQSAAKMILETAKPKS
jgi:phasin